MSKRVAKVNWPDDFQKMYREHTQHPYAIRMLALAKRQEGYAVKHIALMINKSANTVHAWIKLYEAEGQEGLFSVKPGRGRKTKITVEPSIVKAEIQALGANKRGGRIVAEEVRQMIKEKYGVTYSRSATYYLLHRLNFSWISVRSVHPKAHPAEQEGFKENSTKR